MLSYELILILSAFGFMWSEVLTREEMIFGWVGDLLSNLPTWMHKPLYSCAICVTGFWALSCLLYAGIDLPVIHATLSMLLTKIFLRYA